MKYFEPFPIDMYDRWPTVDITRRTGIVSQIVTDPFMHHRYMIKDGDRPDTLAHQFYGYSELSWIIILANNIISLQDDWPVSVDIMMKSIIARYGESAAYDVLFYIDQTGNFVPPVDVNPSNASLLFPLTRVDYENRLNDAKRLIKIPVADVVPDIIAQHSYQIARSSSYAN